LSAIQKGVFVQTAGTTGVHVSAAGVDGVCMDRVGNPSNSTTSTDKDGFEVSSA
jgi:hypothetical protein